MKITLEINLKRIITIAASIALAFLKNKMDSDNKKEIKLDNNDKSNIFPKIAIDFNEKQEQQKQSINNEETERKKRRIQLTQLEDPDNKFYYSPRRTEYITRQSKKKLQEKKKDIKSNNNNFSISMNHEFIKNNKNTNNMIQQEDNKNTNKKEIIENQNILNFPSLSLTEIDTPNLNKNDKQEMSVSPQNTDNKITNNNSNNKKIKIISPKNILIDGRPMRVDFEREENDKKIIKQAKIHNKQKLKPNNETKNKTLKYDSTPTSIITIMSHLDHNYLLKLNIKKYPRWRLSFKKLNETPFISKAEIITIRDEICKPDPIIFITGSKKQSPYEQWIIFNNIYYDANPNPPLNNSHRKLEELVPIFCIQFNWKTWNDFIHNKYKKGYNPENWIWNEYGTMTYSPSCESNQIQLSPINMNLMSTSPNIMLEPYTSEEKLQTPNTEEYTFINDIIIPDKYTEHTLKIPKSEFFDPTDKENNKRIQELFEQILHEQINCYKKQNKPTHLKLPIVMELMKYISYYNLLLTDNIINKFYIFVPKETSFNKIREDLIEVLEQATKTLIQKQYIANDHKRIKQLILRFPFSNKKYEFFMSDTIKPPPKKRRKKEKIIKYKKKKETLKTKQKSINKFIQPIKNKKYKKRKQKTIMNKNNNNLADISKNKKLINKISNNEFNNTIQKMDTDDDILINIQNENQIITNNTNNRNIQQQLTTENNEEQKISELPNNQTTLNDYYTNSQNINIPNNQNDILLQISNQLAELTRKQKELDKKLQNDSTQNISTLDDMLYSDKRGLKAFGVDKQGKQLMKIVSQAIDNDKIEYKYKQLTDILNSNSNKQIAQKLQGIKDFFK